MRFTIIGFRRLWVGATGWDGRAMRFEAVLVPYKELTEQRIDQEFVLQWSVIRPVDGDGGGILDED